MPVISASVSAQAEKIKKSLHYKQFSADVNQFILMKYGNKRTIRRLIKDKEEEIEVLKDLLESLQGDSKVRKISTDEMSDHEKNWLKQTKELLDKDPTFMHGRHKLYCNQFRKRITFEEFEQMLMEVEDNK